MFDRHLTTFFGVKTPYPPVNSYIGNAWNFRTSPCLENISWETMGFPHLCCQMETWHRPEPKKSHLHELIKLCLRSSHITWNYLEICTAGQGPMVFTRAGEGAYWLNVSCSLNRLTRCNENRYGHPSVSLGTWSANGELSVAMFPGGYVCIYLYT